MRMIGFFLTVCLVLAALRAVALVIALGIIGAIIVSAIVQPRKTFGCLATLAALSAFNTYPLAGLLVIAGLIGVSILCRSRS